MTNTEMQLQKSFPMCTYTYTQTIIQKEKQTEILCEFSSYHWRPVLSPNDSPPSLTVWVSLLLSLPFSLSLCIFPVVNFLRLRFRLLHVYLFDRKTAFYDQVNNMTPNRFIFSFFLMRKFWKLNIFPTEYSFI